MIGDRINDSYLSTEVVQVSEPVPHHMMSHYCMDIQDQAPPRPASLSLRFDNSSNNYVDLKTHPISRSYHSVKRSDTMDRDKAIGQLENNSSTPMTPTSFLNPKEITAEQEQFAEQLTKTIDKIKSEREGSLAEEIRLQHHPSSNTSPGYAPTDRSSNPSTPTRQASQTMRVKLGDDDTDGVPTSASVVPSNPMLLSEVSSIHTAFSMAHPANICTNSAVITAALQNLRAQDGGATTGSPPSTTGDSTSPASPSLENPTGPSRYPIVTSTAAVTNRYPSLSLPPLRTDVSDGGGGGGGGNTYASVGLTDMLVGSAEDPVTPTSVGGASALADLTAAVTGQVIVNPTTDGFLHLFHHSTDQNPLMDPNGPRGNGSLNQRHLTSLVSSYESHNLAHPRHLQEYIPSSMPSSYPSQDQQQQQESMLMSQKRSISSTSSMTPPPSTMKRSRRRHEPTIAAAQALINATSNSMGQLSYAPTDVANMVGLKMEDRSVAHQPIQPAVSTSSAANGRRVSVPAGGNQLTSQTMPITYESQSVSRPEASLASIDEEMCSDPSMLKIEKKRARNRLAARRCRERKVNRIVSLEGQVTMLNSYVEQLRGQLETAQKEANQFRLYLEQLSESYPGVQEKLKSIVQPTSQVVPPSSNLHPPPPLPES